MTGAEKRVPLVFFRSDKGSEPVLDWLRELPRADRRVVGAGLKENNELARLTLQCIITNEAITCSVPGMTTVYEVENNVRASYDRKVAMTPQQKEWVDRITEERFKQLPEEYAWLRDWDVV